MAILPFFDDEERKRLALTPGIGGNLPDVEMPRRPGILSGPRGPGAPSRMPGAPPPSPLPETAIPERLPMATPGMLPRPAMSGNPTIAPLSRPERLKMDEDTYVNAAPGRWKSGLLNALRGGLQGLATGGGLGAALGGAISGGALGAINPRLAQRANYQQNIRPQILGEFAAEDAERAAMQAGEDRQLNNAYKTAQIGALNRQNMPQAPKGNDYQYSPLGIFNTRTGQVTTAALPKPPTANDPKLDIEPSSGKSYKQIAIDSYNNRGGDDYVLARMPARTQQIIKKGTVMMDGAETQASPEEVEAALKEFDRAKDRQLKIDIDYTQGDVRGRALGARNGGQAKPVARTGQPGRRAISVQEAADLLK